MKGKQEILLQSNIYVTKSQKMLQDIKFNEQNMLENGHSTPPPRPEGALGHLHPLINTTHDYANVTQQRLPTRLTHLRRRQKQATVSSRTNSRIVAANPVRMAAKSFPAPAAVVVAVATPAETVTPSPLSPPTNDDWLGSQSSGGTTIHSNGAYWLAPTIASASPTKQRRVHELRSSCQLANGGKEANLSQTTRYADKEVDWKLNNETYSDDWNCTSINIDTSDI